MLKYTLISYLILAVAMLYFANKMIGVKNNLQKKVLGSYYSQMEEINKSTGMDVYDLENIPSYNQHKDFKNTSFYNIPEELK